MNNNPCESPDTAGESPARKTGLLARRLVELLMIADVVGIKKAVCVGGNVLFLRSGLKAATLRALISIDGADDAVAQEAN